MCQLALPGMREPGLGQDRQHQLDGRPARPSRAAAPTTATKYAVEAFSDALRFEVRGFGIDVILIEPGLITTKFGEVGAASVGESRSDGPYAEFNDAVAKGTAEVYEGGLARLGGAARGRREEDREGDHRAAPEDPLRRSRRRRGWRSASER